MNQSSETIKQFLNIKSRFESKIKKNILDTVCEELRRKKNASNEDITKLRSEFFKEYTRIKKIVIKKLKEDEKNKEKENNKNSRTRQKKEEYKKKQDEEIMREFSSFTMKELKYNLPMTTSMKDRVQIFRDIVFLSKSEKISLEEAKKNIYQKKGIYIVQEVDQDTNRTDVNNMYDEREYDEYRGSPVYGWNDEGEALYEPTVGANIIAPEYRHAGFEWRNVLEERWLQRSYIEEGETLDTYRGN